ncbi:unnamed protein product [Oreochromis niloticus]|nr:unnamed protein product [Mustela putorius furo]
MICRILLLIILTSCVSGSFVVNVTQTSYQAEENHNITLEWTFTTKPDRSKKTNNIFCSHNVTGHNISVLYHVHEGVEVSESQDEKFSGRVQSDKDALREGRIRLQLSRLRTDDSGLYLCEVNTDYGFSVGRCRLNVTAVQDLSVSLFHRKASSRCSHSQRPAGVTVEMVSDTSIKFLHKCFSVSRSLTLPITNVHGSFPCVSIKMTH